MNKPQTSNEPKSPGKKIKNIALGAVLLVLIVSLTSILGKKLKNQEPKLDPMESYDIVKARSDIYSGFSATAEGLDENATPALKMRYEFDNYMIYLFELTSTNGSSDKQARGSYGIAIYQKSKNNLELKAAAAHLDGLDTSSDKIKFDQYKILDVGPGIKALALSSKISNTTTQNQNQNQSGLFTELIAIKGAPPKYLGQILASNDQITIDTHNTSTNEAESEQYYDIKTPTTIYKFVVDSYQSTK